MGKVFGFCLSNGLYRWLEGFSSGPDVEDLGEEIGRTELQEQRGAAVDIQGLWQEQGHRGNHKTCTEASWTWSPVPSSIAPLLLCHHCATFHAARLSRDAVCM